MKHISLSRLIFLTSYIYFLILPFSLLSFDLLEFTNEIRPDGLEAYGASWEGQLYGGEIFNGDYQSDIENEILDSIFKQFTSYNFENYFDISSSSSSTKIRKIFEKYEMYKYDGFKYYMRMLPGYREFMHNLHREFDDSHKRRQEIRRDYENGQEVLDYVRDEDNKTQREWEQEQQRKREDEQKIKAALEAEIDAKRAVQTEWRQQNLENHKDQRKKNEQLTFATDDEECKEYVELSSELSDMEESCEKFQMLRSFDKEFGYFADFCLEEIQEAYSHADAENYTKYEKHKTRAQAAHQTLREVFSKHQQDYDLNKNTHTYLSKLEIDSKNFTKFYGTTLQHQLHYEIVSTINEASVLMHAYADNLHIHNIVTLACRTADQARMCNKKAQLREGFALSDFCSNVLEMGKRYAFVVAEGFDVYLSAAQEGCFILSAGIGQGVEASGHNIKDFLDKATSDPVLAVSDFIDSTYNTGLALGRLFCFMLESPGKKSSEDLRDAILAFDNKIKAMSNHDRAVEAVALGTEMLLSIGAWEFAGTKLAPITNTIKEFSAIARGELALATHTAAKSPIALKLSAPITEMFGDSFALAKMATEEGRDSVRKAIDIVKRNPSTLKVEKNAVEAVKEVARIEREIEHFSLVDLFKRAEPFGEVGHQRKVFLNNGEQVIFRNDTGKFAHAIGKKYPEPINHLNIEIQKPLGNGRFEKFYKYHFILDENNNYVDHFGHFAGKAKK